MIISFLFIFLIHHLLTFFKNTLTTPKIKDLVNIHTEKYDAIYDVIHDSNRRQEEKKNIEEVIDIRSLLPSTSSSSGPPQLLSQDPSMNMKDELKSFLKKQMHSTPHMHSTPNIDAVNSSTSIDLLDSKTQFSYLS